MLTVQAALSAQESADRDRRPLVLVGVSYEKPLRLVAGLGTLIPLVSPEAGDHGVLSYPGLLVEAGVGAGGRRLAAGLATRVKDPGGPVLFGVDALFTLRWTDDSPRAATANATYLGGEAGLLLIGVRVSVGVATRVAGLDGPDNTILTWSVGAQTGW